MCSMSFNTLWPSDTIWQRFWSIFVHVIPCWLFHAMPLLLKPVLSYFQSDKTKQNSMKFKSKCNNFLWWKCIWICCLQNAVRLVQASKCWSIYEDFVARSKYLRQGKVITSHSLLWDVITYSCLRYLLLATKSTYDERVRRYVDHKKTIAGKLSIWSAHYHHHPCCLLFNIDGFDYPTYMILLSNIAGFDYLT